MSNYIITTQEHALYYAEYGNPAGIPVLFLHGGPGSGCNPAHTQWLAPETSRIIQFDQRGCGRSTPQGSLLGNHTAALVYDIEALRTHLGIPSWIVYGGSWGATLALEYAKDFPQCVLGLLLRGTFLARREDWAWFSSAEGVAQFYPEAYEKLRTLLGTQADENPAQSLYRHVTNPRLSRRQAYRYALAWEQWEACVMDVALPRFNPDPHVWQARINRARIHAHYCVSQFFLPPEGVLTDLDRIQHIPSVIVHGIHDQVCRFSGAWTLAGMLPNAQLVPVEAGHGIHESAIQQALNTGIRSLQSNLFPTLNP